MAELAVNTSTPAPAVAAAPASSGNAPVAAPAAQPNEPKGPVDRVTLGSDRPTAEVNYRAMLAAVNGDGTEPCHSYGPIGPNGFEYDISGQYPPTVSVGFEDQQKGFAATTLLGGYAAISDGSRQRLPLDNAVRGILAGLGTTPPSYDDKTTYTDYHSSLPGVDPHQAYQSFVDNPMAAFKAGGMKFRPETDKLEQGGRYMLEIPADLEHHQPSTWLPIEVSLDSDNNQIGITTLDGHVLRGQQNFTFASDGQGGTTLSQNAAFEWNCTENQKLDDSIQYSGGKGMSASQHETWEKMHNFFYDFNGATGGGSFG